MVQRRRRLFSLLTQGGEIDRELCEAEARRFVRAWPNYRVAVAFAQNIRLAEAERCEGCRPAPLDLAPPAPAAPVMLTGLQAELVALEHADSFEQYRRNRPRIEEIRRQLAAEGKR